MEVINSLHKSVCSFHHSGLKYPIRGYSLQRKHLIHGDTELAPNIFLFLKFVLVIASCLSTPKSTVPSLWHLAGL